MNKVTGFDEEGNIIGRRLQISDTKTACGNWQIPVGLYLLEILTTWHKFQKTQEAVPNIKVTDKNSFAFPTMTGGRRTYAGVRSSIVRFNQHCGFARFDAYSYRHTSATMLFEQKVDPKVVQKLMRHRDIKTTLKIYNQTTRIIDFLRNSRR